MKRLLTAVMLMVMVVGGCATSRNYTDTSTTTVEIFNDSYYEVRIYFNNIRLKTVMSNHVECVKLPTEFSSGGRLIISPIGVRQRFSTPHMNFYQRPGWEFKIGNDYNISSQLGLLPANRCIP